MKALQRLSALTHDLRDEILGRLNLRHNNESWHRLAQRYGEQTGIETTTHFADAVAQAITCTSFASRASASNQLTERAGQWLIRQADPLIRLVLQEAHVPGFHNNEPTPTENNRPLSSADKIREFLNDEDIVSLCGSLAADSSGTNAVLHFYEQFLRSYDTDARRHRGVFYTPENVAQFVISEIDRVLQLEFDLELGLSDNATWSEIGARKDWPKNTFRHDGDVPFIRVLDPAIGTGVFLLELVRHARHRFQNERRERPRSNANESQKWNAWVEQRILPRVCGFELMLPPLALAQFLFATQLAETGYQFGRPGKLHFYLADTLRQPSVPSLELDNLVYPFSVVIGNPPFSGISTNRQPWIHQLLRGKAPHGKENVANYFQVDGVPIAERKHWLGDDYVKFMRFAHWQIELAGLGVVGLVTNHAFLDNSTFRGMRQHLLKWFHRTTIFDLNGNNRQGHRKAGQQRDESVFPIEQGVSINLFRRSTVQPSAHEHELLYTSLLGSKSEKLDQLGITDRPLLQSISITPQPPHYLMVPHDGQRQDEYEQGYRITDIMPINSTAVVTARDPLVVAFNRSELLSRMQRFRDPKLTDNQVREIFFASARSSKYAKGDTRGWRLTDARRKIAEDDNWPLLIRDCCYRPFDRRAIFWTNWMIDWPRDAVMQHLLHEGNLALIARRQSPNSQPCCYFWVTNTIAVDGLIRSDNCGSESVFPMFTFDGQGAESRQPSLWDHPNIEERLERRRGNFSDEFISSCERRWGLSWVNSGPTSPASEFGPHDLLHYIYALFHASTYRSRYAACLRLDFPRIFLCNQTELFRRLTRLGADLTLAHTAWTTDELKVTACGIDRSTVVRPGFPVFEEDSIRVNPDVRFSPVSKPVWDYQVGTYQVCRKWLRDRRGRKLQPDEIDHYRRLLQAVARTLAGMEQIDQAIKQHGGWPAAFLTTPTGT